jgi:hypothetical protein
VGAYAFDGDNYATAYYLPGITGWGGPWGGLPAKLWNPLIQSSGGSSWVLTNGFGFDISGTADIPLVVEACNSLATRSWTCLQTCILTNGSISFSDSRWTNYPARFYRVRSP